MLEELLPLIRDQIEVEIRDIDSKAEWREKFDRRVPVIDYDGQVISEYPLNHGAIRDLLRRMPENNE